MWTVEIRRGTDEKGYSWGGGLFGRYSWFLYNDHGIYVTNSFAYTRASAIRKARRRKQKIMGRPNNHPYLKESVTL